MLVLFHPMAMPFVSQFAPAAVCLAYLAKLWSAGELYGVQRTVFAAWFMTAMAIQFTSTGPWMWIAGFVGQAALAVVLVLKGHLNDIH